MINTASTGIPTGTVTFLYSDIEGSAQLAQQNPAEMPVLLSRHNAILRQSIEAHHGYVFHIRGDAFCAAFFTASDALQAALQAQRKLLQVDWGPAVLKVRMGIHTGAAQAGEAEEESGGYTGYLAMTRVQRVMSLAFGGQILVSNPSAELLHGDLPDGVQLRDMGEHRLKGLLSPERLWQVTASDLHSEFPPLPSLNVTPNNLPVQLSSFIGRKQEVANAVRLLQETRLLTLTGVGGAGKTRIALQAAAESLDAFADGVWFVELAPLADPALLIQSVAAVLGLREVPGRPVSIALLDYLRAKNLLLLLDNCEHLLEACTRLVDHLLQACPELHVLTSSREALGITGERVMQVPSLALPDLHDSLSMKDIARSEAVQLFLERTRSIQPGFALTEQNAPVIAQICRRLDGIPLAIELAAARGKMFSVEQILARLDDRFRLLTGGSRTALPRQQTLRALIDWSYDLLPESEREILRRLSVFAGGWTYEAADAVVGQDEAGSIGMLDLLAHLIDKSLVLVEQGPNGEHSRYRFLETIRQYAMEKLLESGEAASLRNRHLVYFLNFIEEAEPTLMGPEQLRWLDRMETEHDNLRAALGWGLENDPEAALRLAGALSNFWNIRGYISEGRGWLSRGLAQIKTLPPDEKAVQKRKSIQANAMVGFGMLMISQGDNTQAIEAFEESTAMARQIGDKHLLVKGLNMLVTTTTILRGNPADSIAYLEESVALSRELGDNWSLAMSLGLLSYYAMAGGDIRAAHAYLRESVRLSLEVGDPWSTGMSLMGFGMAAEQLGDYTEARARFEESLRLYRKIGDRYRVNMALSELAHLERRQGRYEHALPLYYVTLLAWQDLGHRAAVAHQLECFAFIAAAQRNFPRSARLLGAAEALREEIEISMTPLERSEYDLVLTAMRAGMEEDSFMQIWTEGRAMRLGDAVAYALELANAGNLAE